MPRKGPIEKKEFQPDPVYKNKVAGRLIVQILERGKKQLAHKIFYDAIAVIEDKTKEDGMTVFKRAIDNTKPLLEVKPRRVGGATYQVPVEVNSRRSVTLAIRWIVANSRKKTGKPMYKKLADELMDAASGTGASVKKREDLQKMAEANRAFSHYRW